MAATLNFGIIVREPVIVPSEALGSHGQETVVWEPWLLTAAHPHSPEEQFSRTFMGSSTEYVETPHQAQRGRGRLQPNAGLGEQSQRTLFKPHVWENSMASRAA